MGNGKNESVCYVCVLNAIMDIHAIIAHCCNNAAIIIILLRGLRCRRNEPRKNELL